MGGNTLIGWSIGPCLLTGTARARCMCTVVTPSLPVINILPVYCWGYHSRPLASCNWAKYLCLHHGRRKLISDVRDLRPWVKKLQLSILITLYLHQILADVDYSFTGAFSKWFHNKVYCEIMLLSRSKTCGNCSQSHSAVVIKCTNNKMTTTKMIAKITYIKIRT